MSYLYHVTYLDRLASIFKQGLESAGSSSIGGKHLDPHRRRAFFLTSKAGLEYWYDLALEWRKEAPPVVLRVQKPRSCEVDVVGTEEAGHSAYRCTGKISSKNIDVRISGAWIPLQSLKGLRRARNLTDIRDVVDELIWGVRKVPMTSKRSSSACVVDVRSLVTQAMR